MDRWGGEAGRGRGRGPPGPGLGPARWGPPGPERHQQPDRWGGPIAPEAGRRDKWDKWTPPEGEWEFLLQPTLCLLFSVMRPLTLLHQDRFSAASYITCGYAC